MGNPYHLYDLAAEVRKWEEVALDVETGEVLSEEGEKILDAYASMFTERALDFAALYRELDAEARAVKSEEDRLRARRKALEGARDRIKVTLSGVLKPGATLKDNRVTIAWRKSTTTEVDDIGKLHPDLLNPPPPPSASLTLVKKALESADPQVRAMAVGGAHLEHHLRLQIR